MLRTEDSVPLFLPVVIHGFEDAAISPASQSIRSLLKEASKHFEESASWNKDALRIAVVDALEECAEPDWDGHGAAAIKFSSALEALAAIEDLPYALMMPDVIVNKSGTVGFSWTRNHNWRLSVSLSGDKTVHYAAILGGSETVSGQAPFLGLLPPRVRDLLLSHFTHGNLAPGRSIR